MKFGSRGSGDGEFAGPAGLCVDAHGDIYVADRENNRVQLFDRTGRYVEKFLGDATLSKSGRRYIIANPKVLRGSMGALFRLPAVSTDDATFLVVGLLAPELIGTGNDSALLVRGHPGLGGLLDRCRCRRRLRGSGLPASGRLSCLLPLVHFLHLGLTDLRQTLPGA